jgi:hypothetical protein
LDSIGIGNSGTGRELLFFNANASSFDWFVTSAGPAAQVASLLSILQEPGSPGGTSYAAVFKNGAFLGGDGVYVPQVVNRSFNYIGNSFWNDGRFAGDIAEIVVYNRLLTSTERAGLHNYFQQKYGFGGVSGTFPPGLAAPVNLTASAGDATVNLNWSSTAGAIGYRLYRKVGSGVPAIIATTSNQAYTDSSVANGQTYTYTVRAYNASQESDDSLPASASPIAPPAPPAGIPTDGLILSLNASTLASTLADGQPVSTWTDASSLRKNAYAPGAAPTFVASGIAGRPSVRFDGVDDYLALPAGFENFVNGLSIYMVVRPTAIHNYTKLLLLGNGSVGDSIGLSRASSSEGLLFLTGNSSGGVDWFQTSSGLPTGQASALSVLLEAGPAGSTRFAEIARNGVAIHQEEVFVPSVISRSINYIGNSYWSDGPFQGDFAEILIYNRLLTSAEESAIQTYFNQQYGVSFP